MADSVQGPLRHRIGASLAKLRGTIQKKRRRKQLQNHRTSNGSFPLAQLPDEILIKVGTFVAQLCGLKDFVSLSLACNRHKTLLLDSEETVSKVIRTKLFSICGIEKKKQQQQEQTNTIIDDGFLSSTIDAVRTLEQLAFCETIAKHNLLTENRIYAFPEDGRPDVDLSLWDLSLDFYTVNRGKIRSIHAILQRHPAASVILEAHSGTIAPASVALLHSMYRASWIAHETEATGIAPHRIRIRAWGTAIAEQACRSHGELARERKGWTEVVLRLDGGDTTAPLELPVRPDFYQTAAIAAAAATTTTTQMLPIEYTMEDPEFLFGDPFRNDV